MMAASIGPLTRAHDRSLQSGSRCGVLPRQRPVADITPNHRHRRVPGPRHDCPLADASGSRAGGEDCPQAVAGVAVRIEPRCGRAAFSHERDGTIGQAPGADVTVAVDQPKERAVLNPGRRSPRPQRPHRARRRHRAVGDAHLAAAALLIGPGAPQPHDQAVFGLHDILYVEPLRLGPTERASEARQQRPVPDSQRAVGQAWPPCAAHRPSPLAPCPPGASPALDESPPSP